MLARFREAFSGRVLDVGCGAGRILGYLTQLGGDVHAVDISSSMVEHCRRLYPGADVRVADLASLGASVEGPFDVVLMADNVLDVFDDARRREVLADVRGLLAPGGLAVFSSHNLAHWERTPEGESAGAGAAMSRLRAVGEKLASRSLLWMLDATVRLPRRWSNRKRLAPMQCRAGDHAVINDSAHDYSLLMYYIARAGQERQLSELGYELVDVLEFEGASVPPGADGQGPWLYYVASPR